jgi:hypothetical protein
MLSARGQSVRLYQQDIFIWNKEKVGQAMADLQLEFQILPDKRIYTMSHAEESPETAEDSSTSQGTFADKSVEDLESAFRQIYYYDQSYFKSSIPINQLNNNDHCMHLSYRDTTTK